MRKAQARNRERGSGLFIVILIAAGMAALGFTLLSLTTMGPKISGGLRSQEEAFNAAEAGFNAARVAIEDLFSFGTWTSFAGHYLTQPSNLGLPFILEAPNPGYFRRLTDEELLLAFDPGKDGTADYSPFIYFQQTFALDETSATDLRLTYTAFLIDDEAGGGIADPSDALLVVIGVVRAGTRILSTSRLEIGLAFQLGGGG